ncbi:15844_t:CDS:2 [Entrophospora sp. SA101]|nr:15844_t:CDS:2 [Entrophospora sp. SA101]
MSLVLTSNFMQNLQTQQNNNHIIILSTTEYHSEMQFQILKLLKNLKEGDSEDGLHGRGGGLLGIVSYLSSFQVNHNVASRSTLKCKHVDAHVGSIPIILMEEKADKNDLDLDRSQNLIDEFKVNLSSQDKWKVFQVKLFYDTTKGTQYLEKAVKYVIKVKDDESETLTLYLTPVGVNRKPDSVGKLHIAMYCIVHCVYNVHQRGWCIVELCWPNVVEQNDCFYVIDAGEFAQHHGKAIHGNMLCIFDPVTVDSCKPTTDIIC